MCGVKYVSSIIKKINSRGSTKTDYVNQKGRPHHFVSGLRRGPAVGERVFYHGTRGSEEKGFVCRGGG